MSQISMQPTINTLIDRLSEIIEQSKERRDYLAARLYQRDLILMMVKTRTYSAREIAGAYFDLADLCARVEDFKGVNKYTYRAVEYRLISEKDVPSPMAKVFAKTSNAVPDNQVLFTPLASVFHA